MATDMRIGTVKFFLDDAGYGFIIPDRGVAECFVHRDETDRLGIKLRKGDRVRFETERASSGKVRAINIAHLITEDQ